jgi:hypothetical protein
LINLYVAGKWLLERRGISLSFEKRGRYMNINTGSRENCIAHRMYTN